MNRLLATWAACTLLVTVAASAQPVISGVFNNASYAKAGLPNAGIAQGSIFAIFGSNLGGSSLAFQPSFPLQTTLEGTSVKVIVRSQTVDAIPLYASAGQVGAVLPSNTPIGTGQIKITYNGQTSAPFPITTSSTNFGIFTVSQQGSGPGVIKSGDDALFVSIRPARPGQEVVLWGTGLGAIYDDESAGPSPGDLKGRVPVRLWVGNQPATVTYAGRSGCCAGVDQINFIVPGGISGCNVSVVVQINSSVSNSVTLPVEANGGTCSDVHGLAATEHEAIANREFRLGTVQLSRVSVDIGRYIPGLGSTLSTDVGMALFNRYVPEFAAGAQNPFTVPSVGSCVVVPYTEDSTGPVDPVRSEGLDAGARISVRGPWGNRDLTPVGGFKGAYLALLTSGITDTPYLEPGTYAITGPGGADVGGFSVDLTVPTPLTWTNQTSITGVNRADGLTVTWRGGDPNSLAVIMGASVRMEPSVGAIFRCTAPASAGRFTVPPHVLLSMPPSDWDFQSGTPGGFVVIANFPKPVAFTTASPALDAAYAVGMLASGKMIAFN